MNTINRIARTLSSRAFTSRLIVGLALLVTANISHGIPPLDSTPIAIPGTIDAVNYNLGGEGVAYHDVDAGNNGPASYRTDDVDHESCTDSGTGFNVGWTVAGEWLKYTVNVASNGSYTVTARVASDVSTGAYHIEVDDVDVTGTISIPATGGWQVWTDSTSIVTLSAGQQVIKLAIDGNDLNINRFDITYNGPPPAEPTGLQVDSTGANSVSLSWTAPASGSPTGYNVKRATSSGGPYTIVGTTTAPTVTYTDSVTGGSTYYYVVSALTAGGESGDSSPPVSATPTLGAPEAPTGLTATPGDNQAVLSWTAPAVGSPTSYNVKRSTTSGSGYVALTTPGAQTTTSYADTTAVNGTTYYYVVSAVNAIGEGANSSQASATPAVFTGIYEPFDYPIEDNLLSGTASTADGFGTWNNGVAGWVLAGLSYPDLPTDNNAMRTPAGRQSVSIDDPLSTGTKWISYLWSHSPGDPGANHNGVYFLNGGTGLYFGYGLQVNSATDGYLALASINTVGTSVQNANLLTTTGLHPYSGTKLIVLEIQFNTSGNNDTVSVYVNPPANVADPGDATETYSGFDVGTISGIGMQVAGGGDFITDEIRIADSYPDVVDAVTVAPDAPTGLNATAGTNLVSLSWTASGGGLATGYNVKRSSSSGGPYAIIGTTTAPTVTYDDEVVGGQTYYYVVSAVNGVGESADSSFVSASPILAAPGTPTGLSAVPGDSQVSLSWAASQFATSYDVKRADDIGGPYVSIGTTGALTLDDLGLNNAQTYYYTVAAIGAGGTSADSSPVSATPFGPLPLVLDIDMGAGITFFASNSFTYQVQWASADLGTNTVWNNLGSEIPGDGTTNTVFDPAGPPHNIYQVISY